MSGGADRQQKAQKPSLRAARLSQSCRKRPLGSLHASLSSLRLSTLALVPAIPQTQPHWTQPADRRLSQLVWDDLGRGRRGGGEGKSICEVASHGHAVLKKRSGFGLSEPQHCMATTARSAQQQNDSDTGTARAWQRLAWHSSNRRATNHVANMDKAGVALKRSPSRVATDIWNKIIAATGTGCDTKCQTLWTTGVGGPLQAVSHHPQLSGGILPGSKLTLQRHDLDLAGIRKHRAVAMENRMAYLSSLQLVCIYLALEVKQDSAQAHGPKGPKQGPGRQPLALSHAGLPTQWPHDHAAMPGHDSP
ncbi:MAG: hypothetical protein FRX49_07759 [Trebouxia sp. A1-2]|nr:MAG: hypothetical protein FRX49_07759 [Trebouxia sp. A1-2]